MKRNERAFVLPSTIFSIMIIMIYSILILTFVSSIALSRRVYKTRSNREIEIETVYHDFISGTLRSSYQGMDLFEFEASEADDIRALVCVKEGSEELTENTVLCFIIRNFTENSTICYQKCDFLCDIDESGNLIYGDSENGLSFVCISPEEGV